MLQHTIKAVIRPGEQSGYVAECLEIAVAAQGRTLDEVTRNLQEAVALHLDAEDLAALGLAARPTVGATKFKRMGRVRRACTETRRLRLPGG